MAEQNELQEILKQRFAELPKAVQEAIASADIQKHLRALAETSKLHVDQWDILENEVMMTLFGVTQVEDLQANIEKHVGVSAENAASLASNISRLVYEPIRARLESESGQAGVNLSQTFDAEDTRTKIPPSILKVAPASPPPPPTTQKVERAPVSAAYHAGEASIARTSVTDDPYRETPE